MAKEPPGPVKYHMKALVQPVLFLSKTGEAELFRVSSRRALCVESGSVERRAGSCQAWLNRMRLGWGAPSTVSV